MTSSRFVVQCVRWATPGVPPAHFRPRIPGAYPVASFKSLAEAQAEAGRRDFEPVNPTVERFCRNIELLGRDFE